jgi:plasma kallikrein
MPGRPGHFAQAGIVAWGIGCGENGTPGVYANVALFRTWIDQQMRQMNLDPSVYHY